MNNINSQLYDGNIIWSDDFQSNYTPGDNMTDPPTYNDWSCTHSYFISDSKFLSPPLPNVFSPEMSEFFSNNGIIIEGKAFNSIKVSNEGGDVWKVTYSYNRPEIDNKKDPEGNDKPNSGDWDFPDNVKEGKSITSETSYISIPILSSDKLKDINGKSILTLEDATFLMEFINGSLIKDSNGKWKRSDDNINKKGYLNEPTSVPNNLWKYIYNGARQVYTSQVTTTITYISSSVNINLDAQVGKIVNALGDSPKDGKNYLMTAYKVSMVKPGKKYRIQETYVLSQRGGWSRELYNK